MILRLSAFLILLCFSCASGSRVMTMESFYDIPLGTSRDDLTKTAGRPYLIHKKKNGEEVYEYIERFNAGTRILEERHYSFILRDGKVVDKKYKQESPPAFYGDSYELETTSADQENSQEKSQ